MKRMLVWLTLFAMLFTAMPVVAGADPATSYSKSDIMTAVSGMGRMPSNYYNLAGIGLNSISVSAAQAETFTKKVYQVWAFLSKYAYVYNGNKTIKDVMTQEQFNAVWNYAGKLAREYGNEAFFNLFVSFMNSAKAYKLVKPGVPRSLLGVRFDGAKPGTPATVKVYTTADVAGDVYLEDARGKKISTHTQVNLYPGTLAAFKEHVLTVEYEYAGKNAVRLYGVDAANPQPDHYYFSAMATVASPTADGGTGSNPSASVKKVSAGTVELGTPSTITVTTSPATTSVKITSKSGVVLASSDAPSSANTFTLTYCFPASGSQLIHVYAGTASGSTVLWNKTYKGAKVKVAPAASGATISKVLSKGAARGQEAAIKVYASSKVTRVQLFDAGGDLVDFTKDYSVSGKLRVFTLNYTSSAVGSYKLSVQAGNDANWNASRKKVVVKFSAPTVTKITATKVRKGTASTITVTGSATAVSARLFTSGNQLIGEAALVNGKATFNWTYSKSGKRTVYAQVSDGLVWGPRKAGSVTFTS